jgi:hypothetical protein
VNLAAGISVLDLASLGTLTVAGKGGQGIIFRTQRDGSAGTAHFKLAYKEYLAERKSEVSYVNLSELIVAPKRLEPIEQVELYRRAAWPIALVRGGPEYVGFVMPLAGEQFYGNVIHGGGSSTRVPARLEYLLNSDDNKPYRELTLTNRGRLRLLRHIARTLELLHGMDITVPDLSPRNILYSRGEQPQSFLVDCDSFLREGAGVCAAVETPGWTVPIDHPARATPMRSDCYKFSLLVLRMVARSQTTMDPNLRTRSGWGKRLVATLTLAMGPSGVSAAQWNNLLGQIQRKAR